MKAIITKYHGATNLRGSRISATDCDGNRIYLPYPHELNSEDGHRKAAQALCDKMGWSGRFVTGGINCGYAHVFID